MTAKEKGKYLLEKLEELYPNPAIPLDHTDAYTLLISVLLAARCTDKRVNEITPHLFSNASTPSQMLKMTVEEIREIIKPCGLSPAKSKAIYRLSEILVEKYNHEVPRDIELLEQLPGVGHKTASVVMSQAFGVPAFPVDTHIHRLAYRWGLSNGKSVEQTERDLKKVFPKDTWNKVHLQIIYYGREYSPARGWDLTKDQITLKIGRKSVIKAWLAAHPGVTLADA